jgi:D-alanyl-D-alanine carboxypeptidase (penicillin-binding protein 5/6)
MKAPSTAARFSNATKLLDYGFNNYSYCEFGNKNDVVNSVTVTKGVSSSVNAILEDSCGTLVQKGDEKNIVQYVNLAASIQAPIEKGQKLGEVTYSLNGEIVGTTNIVAESDVANLTMWSMVGNLFKTWYRLLR